MVAGAFNHRDGAAVANAKAFSGPAGGKQPPRRRSIEHGVAENDVFLGREAASLGRPNHDFSAAHALPNVIIRFAFQDHPYARRQKRAETLAGAAGEAKLRGRPFQSPIAAPFGHHSGGARPDGAVDVRDGILADHRGALHQRHANVFRHLERQRVHLASPARAGRRLWRRARLRRQAVSRRAIHTRSNGWGDERPQIQPSAPPRHAVRIGTEQVGPSHELVERSEPQPREDLPYLGGDELKVSD